MAVDPGFQTDNVMTMVIPVSSKKYPTDEQSLAVLHHPHFHIAATAQDDQAIFRRRFILRLLHEEAVSVTQLVRGSMRFIRYGHGPALPAARFDASSVEVFRQSGRPAINDDNAVVPNGYAAR